MIKGPNYKIVMTDDNSFKIMVRIKRNGKDYKRQETVNCAKRQAERRANILVLELEEEIDQDLSSNMRSLKNLGECIDFFKAHTTTRTKSTFDSLTHIKNHIAYANVVNETEFQYVYDAFILQMCKTISYRKRVYSKRTINRFSSHIQLVINFCIRKKKIAKDFSFSPSKFKELPRKRFIEEDEINRLLDAIKEYRPYLLPIVQFALLIPSRRGELVQMRTSWIDYENNCIVIPDEFTKPDMECIKPRPPSMVDYFRSIPKESKFVFFREEKGQYKTLGDFKKAWYFCLNKANIEDLRFHDTRHYSATNLVKLGISEREVMQISGWKTNMLSTYYGNKGISASQSVFEALKEKSIPPTCKKEIP